MDFRDASPDDPELPPLLADLSDRAGHVDLDLRRDAFEQLYQLAHKVRAKAAAAIPCLLAGLVDPDAKIGETASWALHYCAPDSIGPLVGCLSHPVTFVRERAAHSLGNIGDSARDAAAPGLRHPFGDTDQAVRRRAAWALGLVHDASGDTVQILVGMVSHGTPVDAEAALHALGNIGRAAGPEVLAPYRELILSALAGPTAAARRWALYAGESMDLDAQTWADTLVGVVLQDASGEVRSAALAALKGLASAVPALVARLLEPGREGLLACGVLGEMQPRPLVAVPFLQQALARDELVLSASAALWRIEGRADAIIPALRRVFADHGEGVCDLICALGPAAAPLLPDVLEALADESWDLQWAAADALHAIASSDTVVLQPLLDALAHPSPIVRPASARALAAAGDIAVAPLRALLVNPSDPRASLAAYALGEMGPVAAEALSDLRVGMRCGTEPLAGCSAVAVARIAGDTDAVPYLMATLRSDDASAPRRTAARALGELGPAGLEAVDALEAFIDDEDPELADACLAAVAAIRGTLH